MANTIHLDIGDFSAPGSWFRESESMSKELSQDEFYINLSPMDWRTLSNRRRNDFNDARSWCQWCDHIEEMRSRPVTPPTKRSTARTVVSTPRLIALRRDYLSDPAKYFATTRGQRHAIAKLESEILHSAMQRQLAAELMIERQEARPNVAAELIQRAWAQMKAVREAQDDLEKAWSLFDRMCDEMD
jgi:hypothetical protein